MLLLSQKNIYSVLFAAAFLLSSSVPGSLGSDLGFEHDQYVEHDPLVQRLYGNSVGKVVVPEEKKLKSGAATPPVKTRRARAITAAAANGNNNFDNVDESDDIEIAKFSTVKQAPTLTAAAAKSNTTQTFKALPATKTTAKDVANFNGELFDAPPIYEEQKLVAVDVTDENGNKESNDEGKRTDSGGSTGKTILIIVIVVEVLLSIAFNGVSLLLFLKMKGKLGGMEGKKNNNNSGSNKSAAGNKFGPNKVNPLTKEQPAKPSVPPQRPPLQNNHQTLAEKQRRMKASAPPSSFTTVSQSQRDSSKSAPRKAAGREIKLQQPQLGSLSYGTWADDNSGQYEYSDKFGSLGTYSSPLDYLDAFYDSLENSTSNMTKTIDGSLETDASSKTDEFEEISL